MRDIIISLFGTYTPVTYNNGTTDVIPDGLAGVDLVWCSGVLLFAITLYCVFRIFGGLIKNAFGN